MTGDDKTRSPLRQALYRIGFAHPIELRPWPEIHILGRRIQRRRIAAGVAGIAIVLTGAGAANALVARGNAHTDLNVTESPTTTGNTSMSTSTGVAPTTGTAPTPGPGLSTTGAPPPYTTVPAPQPELVGTITVADSTFVVEQPAAVTLTIRNTTDHVWHSDVQPPVHLGVILAPRDAAGVCADAQPADFSIGPHEARVYSLRITPDRYMLGANEIAAVFIYDESGTVNCLMGDAPDGVPPIEVQVVPPGWSPGQPLDAAQGRWDAHVDTGVVEAHAGDTVTVHATARNTGAHEQSTSGFGTLALVCDDYPSAPQTAWRRARFFDPAVVPPGGGETVALAVDIDADVVGTVICKVTMTYHGVLDDDSSRFLETNWAPIEVAAPPPTTTTSTTASADA